jgi:hypothetical protein
VAVSPREPGTEPASDTDAPSNIACSRGPVKKFRIEGLADLAALSTFVNQGEPFGNVPIHAEVSCGRPCIKIESSEIRLGTWQVLIRFRLENAVVKFGSIRSVKLQEGMFQSDEKSNVTLRTINEHQAELGLSVSTEVAKSVVTPRGLLGLKWLWRGHATSNKTEIKTTKGSAAIILIGSFGDDAIAIGDPIYGDPHKQHGLLSHTYPDDTKENHEPLFVLEPKNPQEPMRVSILTAVPFDKLHIADRMDKTKELVRQGIADRVEELRNQMLRDELSKRVSRNQRRGDWPTTEGEFLVTIEEFEIRPTGV